MLGKFDSPDNLIDMIEKSNLQLLDITAEHSFSINLFPKLKRHDPFDRILLSQAKIDGMAFMTSDKFLLGLGDTEVEMFDATK